MRSTVLALAAILFTTASGLAQDAPPPAEAPPAPAPQTPANPPMVGPQMLISTAMGDITLQLDAVRAPVSVANIMRYAREKHYDGTVVYRVVKGFIVQMGSWEANAKGRPGHDNIIFEGTNGLSNLRGTVALAHGDAPDSANAEFFINLRDDTPLDHVEGDPQKIGYTVFGQVISGMDKADAMAEVPVGDKGPMAGQAPVDPILIKKVTLLPSEEWSAQCAAGQIPATSCEKALVAMFASKKAAPAAAKKPAATPPGSKSPRSGR